MTATAMGDTVCGVGMRTRAYLRATFPMPRAKAVADALEISVPLAKKLLQGYAPRMWLFETMVALWDGPFLRAVFAEAFSGDDARLQQLDDEVRALRAELAAARATVGGFIDGDDSIGPVGAAEADADARSVRIAGLVQQLVTTIPSSVRAEEPTE